MTRFEYIESLIISTIIKKCDNIINISNYNLGIWLRIWHYHCPIYFLIFNKFVPIWAIYLVLPLNVMISFSFFLFNGCILSKLEQKLCKDDFNITDIFIESLNLKINRENRIFLSYSGFSLYFILLSTIIYLRIYT